MDMSRIREIRELLGLSQAVLANELGCTQTNVSHYENGQRFPADRAATLITVAAKRKVKLSFDQIYGVKPLPDKQAA